MDTISSTRIIEEDIQALYTKERIFSANPPELSLRVRSNIRHIGELLRRKVVVNIPEYEINKWNMQITGVRPSVEREGFIVIELTKVREAPSSNRSSNHEYYRFNADNISFRWTNPWT